MCNSSKNLPPSVSVSFSLMQQLFDPAHGRLNRARDCQSWKESGTPPLSSIPGTFLSWKSKSRVLFFIASNQYYDETFLSLNSNKTSFVINALVFFFFSLWKCNETNVRAIYIYIYIDRYNNKKRRDMSAIIWFMAWRSSSWMVGALKAPLPVAVPFITRRSHPFGPIFLYFVCLYILIYIKV